MKQLYKNVKISGLKTEYFHFVLSRILPKSLLKLGS